MKRCLFCAKPIEKGDWHAGCSKKFFGTAEPPFLDVSLETITELATKNIMNRLTVPGVQKKLSLTVEGKGKDRRLTIVGLWGRFILKPPVEEYPELPENEDAVMRSAEAAGLPVVPHGLVRLSSGELAYITRRIDRTAGGEKIAMEDLCQLSGRLTEDKYRSSYEQVGKIINRFSSFPGWDISRCFDMIVFSFLVGNSDLHLKNFSLIETPSGMRLSPAYDLLSTALAIPEDKEETALTLNGKKNSLRKTDFHALAVNMGLNEKAAERGFQRLFEKAPALRSAVEGSFLGEKAREKLISLIDLRLSRLASG